MRTVVVTPTSCIPCPTVANSIGPNRLYIRKVQQKTVNEPLRLMMPDVYTYPAIKVDTRGKHASSKNPTVNGAALVDSNLNEPQNVVSSS
jgi:hypothetical protein